MMLWHTQNMTLNIDIHVLGFALTEESYKDKYKLQVFKCP